MRASLFMSAFQMAGRVYAPLASLMRRVFRRVRIVASGIHRTRLGYGAPRDDRRQRRPCAIVAVRTGSPFDQ
jgi:hypothetical protein